MPDPVGGQCGLARSGRRDHGRHRVRREVVQQLDQPGPAHEVAGRRGTRNLDRKKASRSDPAGRAHAARAQSCDHRRLTSEGGCLRGDHRVPPVADRRRPGRDVGSSYPDASTRQWRRPHPRRVNGWCGAAAHPAGGEADHPRHHDDQEVVPTNLWRHPMTGQDQRARRGPGRAPCRCRRRRAGGARARRRPGAGAVRARRRRPGWPRTVPTGWPPARRSRAGGPSCVSTRTSCRSSSWSRPSSTRSSPGETGTTVVLAGLTVFNAVIGLRQESKAEESVKALAQMMKTIARVRRDGQAVEIDAEELVPGDVVLVEAGNLVPADGRVSLAATLEIEEAALTGESLPVGKSTEPVPGEDVPLGDRTCMAYMNTSVTRGRGELIVTATGMDTEIGHIADMLANTETSKTPAAEAAGRAVQDHRVDRRRRAGPGRAAGPGARRVVRHPVRHRRRPRGGRDPDRAAGGGDRAALDGHPGDRPAATPSSSGCPPSRRWARRPRSARTRPAP